MEMPEQIVVWGGQECIIVLFVVDEGAIWELHAPWHLLQPKKYSILQCLESLSYKSSKSTKTWDVKYELLQLVRHFVKSIVFPWDARICWLPIEFQTVEKLSTQSPPQHYVPPNWSWYHFQTYFENPFPTGEGWKEACLFFRCLTTKCP